MFSAIFSSFILFLTQGECHCVELLLSRYFFVISPIVVSWEKSCFHIREILWFWNFDVVRMVWLSGSELVSVNSAWPVAILLCVGAMNTDRG